MGVFFPSIRLFSHSKAPPCTSQDRFWSLPKRVHGETYNFVKIVFPSRRNTNFSGLARYMLIPSWPRATMLARVGPKLIPSCCMLAPVGLKLVQIGPKLTPSWPQVGPCWLKLAPNRTQVGPCWALLAPSGLEVGPCWLILTQIGLKLAPSWPIPAEAFPR